MQIKVDINIKEFQEAMKKAANQVPFALSVAINASAEKAKELVKAEMPRVFDRPTPWVLNSLRVKRSTKTNLTAELAYKDKNSVDNSRSMVEPHVFTGKRHFKAFEARLLNIGLIPAGYNAVPGEGANLDANGNMSQGQISQLLNVLGAYTEAGYNKADDRTVTRLAKGNKKKNIYGFVYWVNKVGSTKATHIPPGVYKRVTTGFGTSLKPILIFVKRASYRKRLDFFGIAAKTINAELPGQFSKAFDEAMRTALLKDQGSLL
jgi:hypothetical protein